jgi:hypothetical protein
MGTIRTLPPQKVAQSVLARQEGEASIDLPDPASIPGKEASEDAPDPIA